MSEDVMWLPVEVSEGQFTEELVAGETDGKFKQDATIYRCHPPVNKISLRLFCAWHDMWLILAVVEVCSSTQLLIFLSFSEVF